MYALHGCAIALLLASVLASHIIVLNAHTNTSACPAISNTIIHTQETKTIMQVASLCALLLVVINLFQKHDAQSAFFVGVFVLWCLIMFFPRNPSNTEVRVRRQKLAGIIHNLCVLALFVSWIIGILVWMETWNAFNTFLVVVCLMTFAVLVVFSLFEHSCEVYEKHHHFIGLMEFVLITSLLWLMIEANSHQIAH